jgi:hypothetical protein
MEAGLESTNSGTHRRAVDETHASARHVLPRAVGSLASEPLPRWSQLATRPRPRADQLGQEAAGMQSTSYSRQPHLQSSGPSTQHRPRPVLAQPAIPGPANDGSHRRLSRWKPLPVRPVRACTCQRVGSPVDRAALRQVATCSGSGSGAATGTRWATATTSGGSRAAASNRAGDQGPTTKSRIVPVSPTRAGAVRSCR